MRTKISAIGQNKMHCAGKIDGAFLSSVKALFRISIFSFFGLIGFGSVAQAQMLVRGGNGMGDGTMSTSFGHEAVTRTATAGGSTWLKFTVGNSWANNNQYGSGTDSFNATINSSAGQARRGDTTGVGAPGDLSITTVNGSRYSFRIKGGTSNNDWNRTFVIMETTGDPVSISTVSDNRSSRFNGQSVTVTITPSAALSSQEKIFVRYSTSSGLSSSSSVEATGSGTTYTAVIPEQTAGTTVYYYVLTTTVAKATLAGDYDLWTLRANNNGGSNYSYTLARRPEAKNPATANPTTAYVGDTVNLSIDAYQSHTSGNRSWAIVRGRFNNADLTASFTEGTGAAPASGTDNVTRPTPVLNQSGTFYWAMMVGYQSGNDFWYTTSSAGWSPMGNAAPSAATLQITVSSITAPTISSVATDAVNGHNEIDLTWTPGATSSARDTVIFRSTSSTAPTLSGGTSYSASTDYTNLGGGITYRCIYNGSGTAVADTSLSANTRYYYYVYAINNAYYSAAATGDTTTAPAVPTGLAASSVSSTGFTTSWNSSTGASSYRLDVDDNSDFSSPLAGYTNLSVSGTSQAVTGLSANTTYYIRVRAFSASGTSASSSSISQLTAPGTPSTPTSSNVGQTGFTVNWSAVTGASKYFLDVDDNSDFSSPLTGYNNLDVGNVTSQAVSSLSAGTTYYARVRASSSGGTSASSSTLTQATSAASATISSSGTPGALSTTYGTASSSTSFSVSGANMSAGILVTPPSGFEVSTDNSTFSSTVTVGSSGTINSTTVYVRLAANAAAGSRSGNIVLSSSGASNVNVATTASTVTAAALTVTASNDSKTYGQTKTYGAGSTAFTSSGLKNSETIGSVTIAASGGAANNGAVGSYALTPSAATGGTFNASNYTITYNTGTLTVNAAALTITASNDSKTYGQTKTYGTGQTAFTSSGLQNSETIGSVTITASGGTAATDTATTYTLTPSAATGGTFTASNYSITYSTGTLTVNKAVIAVTAGNQTVNTGTAASTVTGNGTVNYTGFQNSETSSVITGSVTYTTTYTSSDAAGITGRTITPVVSGLSATNYTFNAVSGTVTVVSPNYGLRDDAGANLPTLTYWPGSGADVTERGDQFNKDLGNRTSLFIKGASVRTYKNGSGDVVGARFEYKIWKQGTTEPASFTTQSLGFTSNDTGAGNQTWSSGFTEINVFTAGNLGTDYGTYNVKVQFTVQGSGVAGKVSEGPYTATFTYPQPAAISTTGTLAALSTTYGTASSSTSFNVSGANMGAGILVTPPSGFEVSTNDSTFSSTVTVGAAGTISATTVYVRLAANASAGTKSGNIALSSSEATSVNVATASSTVDKKALTVTADNQSVVFGTTAAVVTGAGSVTYSGFISGESTSNVTITGTPTYTTTYTDTTAAGTDGVTITPVVTGLTATNYSFTPAVGTITVTALNNPGTLSAIKGTTHPMTSVNLSWAKADNRDVLIVRDTVNSWTTPTTGVIYTTTNNTTLGTGVVVYKGSGTSATDNLLTPGATYFYRFYSENYGSYSAGATASATTDMPQSRSVATPVTPSTLYVGDAPTFSFDSTATITSATNTNWGEPRVYLKLGDGDLASGLRTTGQFTNVNVKSLATTNRFTSSGTWYWGMQMSYGADYGSAFWHKASSASYANMATDGNGSTLTLSVTALPNPASLAVTGTNTNSITLSYSRQGRTGAEFAAVVVRKAGSAVDWTPTAGETYSSGFTTNGNTIVAWQNFTTGITDSGLSNNTTYYYKVYSENFGYYSSGAEVSATTLGPTISATGTLAAVNTTYGTASASPTSFTVSGSYLTGNLTVTPPAGFEVSTSVGSGYGNTVTLSHSNGTVGSTTVYVRFAAATVPGSYSGDVTVSGGGATSQTIATVSSTVSAKQLTITGLTGANKVYDGTNSASVTGTAELSGVNEPDVVSLSGAPTYTFANATVGTNKAITASGYTLSGTHADRYTVAQPTGLTGNITAKGLSVTGLTGANKEYDGTATASATGTASLDGVVAADTANVSLDGTPSFSFANGNVGAGKPITVSGYSLGGSAAGNYSLTQPPLSGDITAKGLTITGASATNRVYDRTVSVVVSGGSLVGVVGSDDVTLGGSPAGATANANVGTGKSVTVTGYSISGGAAGNYSLTQPTGVTVDVTAKEVTVTGASATNRAHNGSTTVAVSGGSLSGVISGDTVTLGGSPTGTVVSAAAGDGKIVTVTGYSISGTHAANYSLTQPTGVTVNITAASVSSGDITLTRDGDSFSASASGVSGFTYSYAGRTANGIVNTNSYGSSAPTAPGYYTVTATSSDSNYAGSKSENYFVTGPIAVADAVTKADNNAIIIPAFDLLANDKRIGGDGQVYTDGLTITGVTSGSGNTAELDGDIFFTPSANSPETFSYTVTAGGKESTAVVTVTTAPAPGPFTLNIVKVGNAAFAGGNTVMTNEFIGVPGQTYVIEYTTNLVTGPWISAGPVSTGVSGSFAVPITATNTNVSAAWNSSMFFRGKVNP